MAERSLGDVLFVNDDAPAIGADGLSWTTAFPDLHDALDAARAEPGRFDAIWMAGGRYTPAGVGGDRTTCFVMVDGVAVRGGFVGTESSEDQRPAADEPDAPATVLSGDLNGDDTPGDLENNKADNSIELVVAPYLGFGLLELDRLVIEGAYRDATGGASVYSGSALISYATENRILGCTIRDNVNRFGDGNAAFDSSALNSVLLEGCKFFGNRAVTRGGALTLHGANATATIADCEFTQNALIGYEFSGGGAVSARCQTLTVSGSRFESNSVGVDNEGFSAQAVGGAILHESRVQHAEAAQDLTLTGCVFESNTVEARSNPIGVAYAGGGAVAASNAGVVVIDDCLFSMNEADSEGHNGNSYGGALAIYNQHGHQTDITLRESRLANNRVVSTASVDGAACTLSSGEVVRVLGCTVDGNHGEDVEFRFRDNDNTGSVSIRASEIEIEDTTLSNNSLSTWIDLEDDREDAAALTIANATTTTLRRCEISGSTLTVLDHEDTQLLSSLVASGARISSSVCTIDSCTITDNHALVTRDIITTLNTGAALVAVCSTAEVRNSLIAGNSGPRTAGVIIEAGGSPDAAAFSNCTIADNRGGLGLPSFYDRPSAIDSTLTTSIVNSIIWNNTDALDNDAPGPDEQISLAPGSGVDSSIVQNLDASIPGVGNLDADPMLVSPASGDFRLAVGSPAIDSGDSSRVPIDLLTDLDGNPRVLDDPTTADSGVGFPVVDRGAFEFLYDPACAADIASPFGVLDLADIVAFVTAFSAGGAAADVAEPYGILDLSDITAFVVLFTGGCDQ